MTPLTSTLVVTAFHCSSLLDIGRIRSEEGRRTRCLECRKIWCKYYIEWNFVHPPLSSSGRKMKHVSRMIRSWLSIARRMWDWSI